MIDGRMSALIVVRTDDDDTIVLYLLESGKLGAVVDGTEVTVLDDEDQTNGERLLALLDASLKLCHSASVKWPNAVNGGFK